MQPTTTTSTTTSTSASATTSATTSDRKAPSRPAVPQTERGRAVEARAGGLAMLPLVVGYVPFGLLVGVAIARSSDWLAAWTGTMTVYGGSAQLVLLELLSGGAAAWTAAGAAVLVNARLVVYSLALVPLFASARLPVRLLAAAFVIDPTWLVAMRREQSPGTLTDRRWDFAGAAIVLTLGWLVAVTAGLFLGRLSTPVLSVIGPLCLLAMVVPHLRLPGGAVAVLAAVLTTLAGVAGSIPSGSIPLLAMGAAAAAGLAVTGRAASR